MDFYLILVSPQLLVQATVLDCVVYVLFLDVGVAIAIIVIPLLFFLSVVISVIVCAVRQVIAPT